nr:craniofacial development protein 2-like [Tanacetum cinerariifolium]
EQTTFGTSPPASEVSLPFSKTVQGSTTARNEVGVILAVGLKDKVVQVTRRSDMIMEISIVKDGETVNVISAYTLHVGLSDVVKKSFLDALDELVRDCLPDQLLIIGGDLNGHIGAAADGYAGALPSEACSSQHILVTLDVLFERQRQRMAETGRQRILWKNFKRDVVETFRVTISEKISTFGEDMSACDTDQM